MNDHVAADSLRKLQTSEVPTFDYQPMKPADVAEECLRTSERLYGKEWKGNSETK